jgi:hypothetical protein
MKRPALLFWIAVCLLTSCREKPAEVTLTETRRLTSKDVAPKLDATSDERFRDAKASPVQGETPAGWLKLPATQMRLLNYRFGESGFGEVWVSISAGSVLDNVNRWLGQFGAEKLDAAGLAKLRRASLAGMNGVWVEAGGDYAGGMGAPPRTGYALAGVVVLDPHGRILTVKMVGPKSEVAAAKDTLEAFARGLRFTE